MRAPSVRVMRIISADPELFESVMGRLGFRLVRRENDPLSTQVQNEDIDAIAAVISEDSNTRLRIHPYHKQLQEMAQKMGYIVVMEMWHRDNDEFAAIERDAREAEEAGFGDDLDNEESGIPSEMDHLAPAGPPIGQHEQEGPTGQALWDQMMNDVDSADTEHPPW